MSETALDELAQLEERLATVTLERDEYRKLAEVLQLELERTRRHLFGQKAEHVDAAQAQLAFLEIAKKLDALQGEVERDGEDKPWECQEFCVRPGGFPN